MHGGAPPAAHSSGGNTQRPGDRSVKTKGLARDSWAVTKCLGEARKQRGGPSRAARAPPRLADVRSA